MKLTSVMAEELNKSEKLTVSGSYYSPRQPALISGAQNERAANFYNERSLKLTNDI